MVEPSDVNGDQHPPEESPDQPIARPTTWSPTDSVNSLLAVAAFIGLNSLAGLKWAIAGTTMVSLYAMYSRQRRGLGIGVFIPMVAVILIGRAILGIVTDSKDVYFGSGIALKFIMAAALVVSVVIHRNAVSRLAPNLISLPNYVLKHELYRSTGAGLRLIWAAYLTLSGIFDTWLLSQSSANGFVLIRFLVAWPLSTAAGMIAIFWANSRMNRIPGFPGLLTLFEEQLEADSESKSDPVSDSETETDSDSDTVSGTDEQHETDDTHS